ncbi:hypothetical protein GQ55_9G437600 [Panicum hallii var. hallii]|uniref:Uncharacterized protein n=1 Tax=Panicum hallii var. hallii TaxID=1504633 RepID=A0A2T7CB91_9POAL|nr:hypothetical protein GQ55_9G437600 [Panicum hallii var. hallii]
MSSITVLKSSPAIVVPSEAEPEAAVAPKAGETVGLSSFDKRAGPFPVTMLLAYDRPIHEPVETIKRSLSRALAHYQPMAGRLSNGDDAGIVCSGEGVLFVGARASCDLEELLDDQKGGAARFVKDLALSYPSEPCRESDPLLLVQVTEFTCGGFVLGVTWNHVAADGAGMAQFLQAVGELARGVSPPSVSPVRHWDDSIPGLPAPMATAQKPSSSAARGPQDMVRLDVTIPWSLISDIRAAGVSAGGKPCTVFEAVAAVLWKCRTRASLSAVDPRSPAPLLFPCNLRALVGASAGYYGNCTVVQVVSATTGVVADSAIGDLVGLIRLAKEKVPDVLRPSSDDGNSNGGGRGQEQEEGPPVQFTMYNVLAVLSWRNLGFEAADMGSGGASRVMWDADPMAPGCVACPPRKGRDDGVSVSSICVKPEHADAFLGELAKLTASNN